MADDDGLVGARIDHLNVAGGSGGRSGCLDLPPEGVDPAGIGYDGGIADGDGQGGHRGEPGAVGRGQHGRKVGGAVIPPDDVCRGRLMALCCVADRGHSKVRAWLRQLADDCSCARRHPGKPRGPVRLDGGHGVG